MNQIQDILHERFGLEAFRPGQQEVIEALLAGENAAAVFPTGSGKSLCYQLPAVALDGVSLVVSPLLALMKDQVDALTRRNIPAARLDSTLSPQEYSAVLTQAKIGTLKLLYVAPERFQNERFREFLKSVPISLFAVDEAHCVSEWGHNFRPDYLKLARAAAEVRAPHILALTATATPKVLDDICRTFSIGHPVRTPFHRSNLILNAEIVESTEAKLTSLRSTLGLGPTVIYVTHQKSAETLARRLAEEGWPARPYHAGLEAETRAETQEWFLHSTDGVVVATIAFGMGIDKPDIRCVVHFDPPKSMESYSQEIGRAGRDGLDAYCLFLYFPADRIPLENFAYGDTPTRRSLHTLIDEIFSTPTGEEVVLNLYELSTNHDIRPLVLRTLLTYLEIDGYLQEKTPIYSSYQFKALLPSQEILAELSGEPRAFLANLLRQSVKKRVWFSIDLESAQKALNTTRDRIIKALDWCHENGYLEVQATDLRHRYRLLKTPGSLEALAAELDVRARVREEGEVARLDQVIALASEPGCLSAKLSQHFGEKLPADRCGRCDDCQGVRSLTPHASHSTEWTLPELPDFLCSEPRSGARFLCGIVSPALSKRRLTRDPNFGKLSHVRFREVLDRLTSADSRL